MLSHSEINDVANAMFSERLGDRLRGVSIAGQRDSLGEESLLVTIEVSDDVVAEMLSIRSRVGSEMRAALEEQGESRFAFVDFTSPAERREVEQEDAA